MSDASHGLIGTPEKVEIVLVDYDATWPDRFEAERRKIAGTLGPAALAIEHVGSTAVPGLAAKPIIDICLVVGDSSDEPALTERNLTADAVVAILLTHGHGDHTAGCRMFPHAEVYAMESEIPTVGDAAKVTHPLKDGDRFDVGDQHVEAYATPGHTPGSAVYFARGVLFFGDSAGASKDGEVMRAVRLFSKDPAQNVASLKGLVARFEPRAAEVKKLAFAHTGPLDGLAPLQAFARAH